MALVAAARAAPAALVRRGAAPQGLDLAAALQALQVPQALRVQGWAQSPLVALSGALGWGALAGAAGTQSRSPETRRGADFQRSEAVDGGPCRSRRRHPGKRELRILQAQKIHGIFVVSDSEAVTVLVDDSGSTHYIIDAEDMGKMIIGQKAQTQPETLKVSTVWHFGSQNYEFDLLLTILGSPTSSWGLWCWPIPISANLSYPAKHAETQKR